jgi:hypothetical protein
MWRPVSYAESPLQGAPDSNQEKGQAMSTATATHHRFPHPIALAAAATAVIVGGAAAIGVAVTQNDATTAPSQSHAQTYPQHQQCPDPRCSPHQARGGFHNSRSVEPGISRADHGSFPSPFGGRTVQGLP